MTDQELFDKILAKAKKGGYTCHPSCTVQAVIWDVNFMVAFCKNTLFFHDEILEEMKNQAKPLQYLNSLL